MNQHFQRIFFWHVIYFAVVNGLWRWKPKKKIIDQKIVLRPNAPMTTTTITHNTNEEEGKWKKQHIITNPFCLRAINCNQAFNVQNWNLPFFHWLFEFCIESHSQIFDTNMYVCVWIHHVANTQMPSFVIFLFETTFISPSTYHHSSACVK